MSLADKTLRGLLVRGERARLRHSDRAIRVSFKEKESPYWSLDFDQRDHFHAQMRAAVSAGAVTLIWSRHGGEERPLDYAVLQDVDCLAVHLGASTVAEDVAAAHKVLEPFLSRERIGEILAAWQSMKQVRGLGPASAPDFAAACRVVDALTGGGAQDRVVRQLSVELFGKSKRIERLSRHLDILTAEHVSAPARHWQEVFGAIGLTKEPQPFLIAGDGTLVLRNGQMCPLIAPFVGVSNQVVSGYLGAPEWLLSIENLTTFHLAAMEVGDRTDGVILYTGGMPSPAWRTAYRTMLDSLSAHTAIYHWGDFDEGGFRIASILADTAKSAGKQLKPWLMSPDAATSFATPTTSNVVANMVRCAALAGWDHLAASIGDQLQPVTFEQESLRVKLPGQT